MRVSRKPSNAILIFLWKQTPPLQPPPRKVVRGRGSCQPHSYLLAWKLEPSPVQNPLLEEEGMGAEVLKVNAIMVTVATSVEARAGSALPPSLIIC